MICPTNATFNINYLNLTTQFDSLVHCVYDVSHCEDELWSNIL